MLSLFPFHVNRLQKNVVERNNKMLQVKVVARFSTASWRRRVRRVPLNGCAYVIVAVLNFQNVFSHKIKAEHFKRLNVEIVV